jgi:hypothetical protein
MATKIASKALKLFGPPQLIDGEDCSAYEELHERVWLSLEPVDILEEIWVRDFVDLTWEVLRWRRLKSSLMAASAFKGLQKVLETADAVMAQTLCENLEAIRTMETMTALAERRRDDAVCQIERHRVALALRARRIVQQLEDEDCQIVDASPTQSKSAA